MIANFFRHLDAQGARWLLVSGQATILYGAATFSEDVDLWVEPSTENLARLEVALRASGARYYKLTPPLTSSHALGHHGFHFTLPIEDGSVAYLDVMGVPPRVDSFDAANARARYFETAWGRLPTVSIPDLVELKKTQRPRDYPIISRLSLLQLAEQTTPDDQTLRWVVDNVFTLSELRELARAHPEAERVLPSGSVGARAIAAFGQHEHLEQDLEDELEAWFDARMAPLRRADRRFWRTVIDELRGLRTSGQLVPEGTLV
jgi:hypothetical protein